MIKARLHGFDRSGANNFLRACDFHPGQFSRPFKQGVGRNRDARSYDPAEVLTLRIDRIESRGRAEVDHDARRAVFVNRRHRVHDAISPDIRCRLIKNP